MNPELKRFMADFCDVVMPGHNKAKGYINVKKKLADLLVDRRAYYHWKNCECFPRLPDIFKRLNEKGFTIQIIPLKIYK